MESSRTFILYPGFFCMPDPPTCTIDGLNWFLHFPLHLLEDVDHHVAPFSVVRPVVTSKFIKHAIQAARQLKDQVAINKK